MNAILEFFLPFGRYRVFSPRFFCSVLFLFLFFVKSFVSFMPAGFEPFSQCRLLTAAIYRRAITGLYC